MPHQTTQNGNHALITQRFHSSSFLGLPYRILNMNPKKELLWSLNSLGSPKVWWGSSGQVVPERIAYRTPKFEEEGPKFILNSKPLYPEFAVDLELSSRVGNL